MVHLSLFVCKYEYFYVNSCLDEYIVEECLGVQMRELSLLLGEHGCIYEIIVVYKLKHG